MKSKVLFVFFAASIFFNLMFFFQEEDVSEIEQEKGCFLYPENISSIDYGITPHEYYPRLRGYSIAGEITEFLDFYLKGTIISSIQDKYDIDVPVSFIRNIQEIAYFFNDYKVSFSEGDRISLLFRISDNKIVYMRFENSRRRSVHETFLFNSGGKEVYVAADGSHLQPCITNGPFEGCPQVSFATEQNTLIPVFETSLNSEVKLPFLAKVISVSQTSDLGGEVEIIYSNHMIKAMLKGLNRINSSLKKDVIYQPRTKIGQAGYPLQNNKKGVVYYLRRKDNSVLSPFSFHHTEKVYVREERQNNLKIAANFYDKWYRSGINFEKKHY